MQSYGGASSKEDGLRSSSVPPFSNPNVGGATITQQKPFISVPKQVMTIVKCFIGSGVLFLPKAFSNGGWLFSSISFVLCAILTNVCISKLIECLSYMPPGSDYGHMGSRVAGRFGALAVDFSLVGSQAGFCCVYISFVARNLIQLLNDNIVGNKGCWVSADDLWLFILVELFLLAPLTWVRRLSSFTTTNTIANGFIASGLLSILCYCISSLATSSPRGGDLSSNLPAVGAHWPLMFGTAIYAFEGAGMVIPMFNELQPSQQVRFPVVFSSTLAGVSLLYIVVGLVPYVYYKGYSTTSDCTAGNNDCVQDTITLNLPHIWWSYAVTFGYCIALVFSYPFMLFPAMEVIESAWLPSFLPSWGDEVGLPSLERRSLHDQHDARGSDGPSDSLPLLSVPPSSQALLDGGGGGRGVSVGASPPLSRLRTNLFRTLVCVLTLLISYVGAPQLDNMVSLIGAFCCTPIAFIFPAWFHARLVCGDKAERRGEKIADWIIVVMGGGIMCFSTGMAINSWKTSEFNPCIEG